LHGWALYINGNPGTFGMPGSPFVTLELLSTDDGGKSFHLITPPAADRHPAVAPVIDVLNGSILQFPRRGPMALPAPRIVPGKGCCSLTYSPAAGGPSTITGSGFLRENTVLIGSHAINASSSDGKNVQFIVPRDVLADVYKIHLENRNGKTGEYDITIRAPESLKITNINNGQSVHAGQEITLSGSGISFEDVVWFGAQALPSKFVISGAPMIIFSIPASTPPGSYDVHVTHGNESSNVISVRVD
jgi:hypothetical protein